MPELTQRDGQRLKANHLRTAAHKETGCPEAVGFLLWSGLASNRIHNPQQDNGSNHGDQ